MKCFFALSSKGWVQQFNDMALVLARSARANTTLQMFCIYDGPTGGITTQLQQLGVTILSHTPCYAALLEASANSKQKRRGSHGVWTNPDLWNGTFLRLEIPLLMHSLGFHDAFVLYVDADTFFQSDPRLEVFQPDYLAAASEGDPCDTSFFNAGIMLLNTHTMHETYPRFIQFCQDQDFVPKQGLLDQGLYNTFYKNKWLHLPPIYNWKAYWAPNPLAKIIHFHGPNPDHIAAYLANNSAQPPATCVGNLLTRHTPHLAAHLAQWQTWLNCA